VGCRGPAVARSRDSTSNDTASGGSSEALALTDGKAISQGSISCLERALGELRERFRVERAAGHPVRRT